MVVWYWLPQNNSLIKTSCNTRLIDTMHMHTVWFWRVALKSYLYWPAGGKINHIFWLRSHKLKSFKSLLNLKSSLRSLPLLWCSILWRVVEGACILSVIYSCGSLTKISRPFRLWSDVPFCWRQWAGEY